MGAVKYPEPLVFGLDIGTRSIVGTVGYKDKEKFNVIAMAVKYHESRAMIDGQIHDIAKVSEAIVEVKRSLEEQLNGYKLKDVCIAAAGRVLKTAIGHGEYVFSENTSINQEYIHSIELIGVEKAHNMILEEAHDKDDLEKYYCVGYTVVKYYLNDYEILKLEGHKGTKISADVLATFLPEEVVNSLYTAVEHAGLNVCNLTLEPIAAIDVAIPENYRLLNIALIDVGAGTSDICITKDGSIIGYGMISSAGDEMTEALIKKYLIDFDTAEKLKSASPKKKSISYKDIMGITHKITPAEINETLETVKEEITKKISDKIIELNGGTPVSAVFVVGGGGKITGFTDLLADALELPHERVALRGEEVMNDINFLLEDFKKDSLYVTPVGICLNFYDQKNNFIFVTVNEDRIKLYNNDRLTIFDAAAQYGLPNEAIFPKRGDDITFTINGKKRIVRGYDGEAALIKQNGRVVGLNEAIQANDIITIKESTKGKSASVLLSSLPEYSGTIGINVNGNTITCPKFAEVNNEPQLASYEIKDNDDVIMQNYYTLEQLLVFLDYRPEGKIYINNKEATSEDKIYENFVVTWNDQLTYEDLIEESKDVLQNNHNKINSSETKNKNILSDTNNKNSLNDTINKDDITDNKSNDSNYEIQNTIQDIQQPKQIKSIKIKVNHTDTILTGKADYTFVDIFDFYPFDLSTLGGDKLITRINGKDAEYIDPIFDGCYVDLFWE